MVTDSDDLKVGRLSHILDNLSVSSANSQRGGGCIPIKREETGEFSHSSIYSHPATTQPPQALSATSYGLYLKTMEKIYAYALLDRELHSVSYIYVQRNTETRNIATLYQE